MEPKYVKILCNQVSNIEYTIHCYNYLHCIYVLCTVPSRKRKINPLCPLDRNIQTINNIFLSWG